MREHAKERSTGIEIDLQELLMLYLRKLWAIVLCAVLVASVAFGGAYFLMTPMYKANVSVYVNNNRENTGNGYVSYNDLNTSMRLVSTYINIVTSDRVLEKVVEALDNEYTVEEIARCLSAEQLNDTEIFRVFAIHPDPEEAARIANAVAQVAPDEIASIIEGSSARIIDMAKIPKQKASPNYTVMALLGAVVGVLIAVVSITVRHLSDTRIKDEDDLITLFELPILGRIPDFNQITTSNQTDNAYATANGRTAK